jgi:hypothetical protein
MSRKSGAQTAWLLVSCTIRRVGVHRPLENQHDARRRARVDAFAERIAGVPALAFAAFNELG